MAGKFCVRAGDIPTVEHFAIIYFDSIYIPGDQRSIDCPGHGYPASTEVVAKYLAFTDRTEWEEEIESRMRSDKKNFTAIQVKPVSIKTKIVIDID